MRVLALDAATEACSVALFDDAAGLGPRSMLHRSEEIGRGHADRLLAMVGEVLAEAGYGLQALTALAVSVGPGAFTGVRITVATAQGLAFGADLPIVPISTLEALAWRLLKPDATGATSVSREGAPIAAEDWSVLACLDARMGEVYWGTFRKDTVLGLEPLTPARVSAPEALRCDGPTRGVGRGFAAYPQLLQIAGLVLRPEDRQALPDARELVSLSVPRLAAGLALDAAALAPGYLRDKVALTDAERASKRTP
jgi:tRNA threonylcarbamoyladenosine biosynthesis protein TsaB